MKNNSSLQKNQSSSDKPKLNHWVFWPPFLLMLSAVALNLTWNEAFSSLVNGCKDWTLDYFGWMFLVVALAATACCVFVSFSEFGKVRLGGPDAKPLMSMWNWFAITICTTVAVGILLWSTAEPLEHFRNPPATSGIEAGSPEAARFALSTMYLHWSFIPYAIYAAPSLMFGLAFYNLRLPYSLGSTLVPIFGRRWTDRLSNPIDAISLYSLVAGMSASLGGGLLVMGGGLNDLFGIQGDSWFVLGIIAIVIVTTFIVSSVTGLMQGIRILSDINVKALLVMGGLVFLLGPSLFLVGAGVEATGEFLTTFFQRSLSTGAIAQDSWSERWTIFYWANWLAWTPVTACFLGRIAYGRTVREFMVVNFLLPSLFSIVWMTIFSGSVLHMEINQTTSPSDGLTMFQAYRESGAEAMSYRLFRSLPFGVVFVAFYWLSAFVSFVTSADSNTSAMASLSSSDVSPDNPESDMRLKIAWGVMVGTVAWVMVTFADIEGIKTLSVLGGLPALLLELLIVISLMIMVISGKMKSPAQSLSDEP